MEKTFYKLFIDPQAGLIRRKPSPSYRPWRRYIDKYLRSGVLLQPPSEVWILSKQYVENIFSVTFLYDALILVPTGLETRVRQILVQESKKHLMIETYLIISIKKL